MLDPEFTLLEADQVDEAIAQAQAAFSEYRALDPESRAAFLDSIADNIENDAQAIVDRAVLETGLPVPRLNGEIFRTANQLRLFSGVVRLGDAHGVRIDPSLPERAPLPRPDLRQRRVPLGPVAVFGASNFPLAFSTAGGDTASALAAGCPVVVKAHNAHPGTNELVGEAIRRAVADHDLHPGVFSLVFGKGTQVGQQLAADHRIAAIGFTGSRTAGLALTTTASSRPVPIPVFAEMSSVNPVFVLPGAIEGDVSEIAEGFLGAVTGSSGQLCTAPGLLFLPKGERGDNLAAAIAEKFSSAKGQTMLTSGISSAWEQGVEHLSAQPGVAALAQGSPGDTRNSPAPQVFTVELSDFVANASLQSEIFGAAALIVRYGSNDSLRATVTELEGQLTATVHLAPSDHDYASELLDELELRAGRIIVNGWPTGVDVGSAMIHGGPFPATSAPQTTSVGATAIDRFLRPVAYQNVPDDLLPAALQETNPWNLNRIVEGVFVSSAESTSDGAAAQPSKGAKVVDVVRERLAQHGHELLTAKPAAYSYEPVTVVGNMAFVSGQIAKLNGGEVPIQGRVGDEIEIEDGVRAAEICVVNLLAQLETHLGLDKVERIAKINVYVASDPAFTKHPVVAEGASTLLREVLGDAGRHSRTAVGVPRLPKNTPVELEAVVELRN